MDFLFNQEAEDFIIGNILLYGNSLFDEACEFIKEPIDFFQESHRLLWKTFSELKSKRESCDLTSVTNIFRDHQLITIKRLMDLCNGARYSNTELTKHYAELIRKNSIARQGINCYRECIKKLQEGADPREIIPQAMHENSLLLQDICKGKIVRIGEGMLQILDDILESKSADGITGIPTGYSQLDLISGGLQTGYYLLAARPSVGKTTYALNIARNVANKTTKKVLVFSLEMKAKQLRRKLLAMDANVNSKLFNNANLINLDIQKQLTDAAGRLYEIQIYLCDQSRIKASELEVKAKQFKAQNPDLGLIIIDYAQLIEPETKEGTLNEKTGETSRNLKIMADDLDLPVIVLCQLTRGTESRENKIPELSDLRNSGSLEQDADVVDFLYRKDYYDPRGFAPDPSETELIRKKNRLEGGLGAVQFDYYKANQRYVQK